MKEIGQIITEFENSNLSVFHLKKNGEEILLSKTDNFFQNEQATSINDGHDKNDSVPLDNEMTKTNSEKLVTIESSLVGICLIDASEGGEPIFKPGDLVKKGDVICNIESMKILNEVYAPSDGIFDGYLIKNGDVVDASQPLASLS
ncbi:biotin/lipoyl-containing protein (plasmid) [Lactiplantibacillus plantarum]|uniref:acetyl-CoA carboxylase biotin carboxyl carrier protein n=1 Tax=Lactiplantibacillus plantarum TaxID=1590 RepID=UPI00338EA48C